MRRGLVLTFVAVLVALVGVSTTAPAAAQAPTYRAFVACSRSPDADPAQRCPRGSKIGAFFESSVETTYKICVHFPSHKPLCAGGQQAEPGALEMNSITTSALGPHDVIWEVDGRRIVRHFVLTR